MTKRFFESNKQFNSTKKIVHRMATGEKKRTHVRNELKNTNTNETEGL
jgi:hypothetical protein